MTVLSPLKRLMAGALVCFTFTLPSCADRNAARDDANSMAQRADQNIAAMNPQKDIVSPLTEESAPWFGNTAVLAQSSELLPENLEKDNALVLTFEKPLTIDQVADRIEAGTGLRVQVDHLNNASSGGSAPSSSSASSSGGASGAGGEQTFSPADGQEVAGGRTIWQGKLSRLLDQVSDRFDAEWKYSNGVIHISQQIVRTFMLHALAGSTDIGGSVKTGTTGASSGLPQQSVDSSSKLVVWDEIQKAIDTIVGSKAKVAYSPGTGTITVAGTPSAVGAVESYLRMQNKMRLRRVSIEAKVLSVQLNKTYDNNFDLNVVVKNAFTDHPFQFSSLAATGTDVGRTVQAGILSSSASTPSSTQAVINALSAVANRVSVEYSGSLVTLSDQPAPLQVATKRSYVARVSGSSSDTTSSTSLEPGTLDIGLSMNLLPRVIEQDRIMLRIALGITDLVQLREFTSGGTTNQSTIQLPEIDSTGFLQNAVLNSGETLVLAGFERKSANDQQTGTGAPANWLLGGGEQYGQGREIRVLMITANVLPEEPVNVVRP